MHNFKTMSIILFFSTGLFFSAYAQKAAVKTNIPYLVTTTPNLALEFAVGDKMSIELSGGVNPFSLGENKQLKHWVVWPELRYWTCETFNGHFFGLHGVGGQFNVGGLDIPIWKLDRLKDRRYDGSAIGAGISYGYQWIINDHWGFEFTVGGGFARFDYEVYNLGDSGSKLGENKKNYFGPTKAGLSIVYVF